MYYAALFGSQTARLLSRRSGVVVGILALLTMGLGGCSGKDPSLPDTVSVAGKVTLDGEPLKEGVVTFHPKGGTHAATGQIGENGIYSLTTFSDSDGAPVGNYIATVQVFPKGANPGFEDQAPGYVKIPKKYTDVKTSDLLVEVKPGPNTINLEMKSKK